MVHHLTQRKFEKAEPILEKYRQQLIDSRRMDWLGLESELCNCWKLEFANLRTAFIDLLRLDRYQHLAAYYMQHERPDRPAAVFIPHLAKLYGLKSYDDADRNQKVTEFWQQYFEVKSLEPAFAASEIYIPRRSGPW